MNQVYVDDRYQSIAISNACAKRLRSADEEFSAIGNVYGIGLQEYNEDDLSHAICRKGIFVAGNMTTAYRDGDLVVLGDDWVRSADKIATDEFARKRCAARLFALRASAVDAKKFITIQLKLR